ncbi:MAG: class I SAM-dependent methyltransferase [Acutalibacteraceae bacterium]
MQSTMEKVLIPMCALGQTGAYMAQKGFFVTAFDITKEMIDEGKKRFGSVENLSLKIADICNLHLGESDFDFCFIATQDLHLLSDFKMVKKAFRSLASHLREGGGLSLELVLPSSESFELPKQTFYPQVPNYTDKKVWKESKNRYDAFTKRLHIDQIVYIQDEKGITSFPYSVTLQYYEQDEIRSALKDAGFMITGEFQNRNKELWTTESSEWIIESIKK